VGENSDIDRVIAHIAARQQRQLKRSQLLAAGWDDDAIRWRIKAGRLYREHPGVYSLGCRAVTPLERAMAAVLACGPGAALSHGSAMALWGIWKRWQSPFHVTTSRDRRPKGIRVHRVRALDRRDVTRQHGIPVTTLARTLLDQAPHMSPKSLTRAINDARQDHYLQLDALAEVLARNSTHRGRAKLAWTLGRAPERPTRSQFEDDFPAFCERYGLPRPQMNAIVCGYEVDALFAEEKVIVELDSWRFHSSRVSFESDRGRDADTLVAGFATVRLTRERYRRHPAREAQRLKDILARRRARAA
jgi:hypothetical protein